MNEFTNECVISIIGAGTSEAHNAYEFFQFDKQPEFQYAGTVSFLFSNKHRSYIQAYKHNF